MGRRDRLWSRFSLSCIIASAGKFRPSLLLCSQLMTIRFRIFNLKLKGFTRGRCSACISRASVFLTYQEKCATPLDQSMGFICFCFFFYIYLLLDLYFLFSFFTSIFYYFTIHNCCSTYSPTLSEPQRDSRLRPPFILKDMDLYLILKIRF